MDIIKLLGNAVGVVGKSGWKVTKSATGSFTQGVREGFSSPSNVEEIVDNVQASSDTTIINEEQEQRSKPLSKPFVQTEFDFGQTQNQEVSNG